MSVDNDTNVDVSVVVSRMEPGERDIVEVGERERERERERALLLATATTKTSTTTIATAAKKWSRT